MSKTIINNTKAPEAVGTYSQGVECNGVYYFSGQIGLDPQTEKMQEGVKAQLERFLDFDCGENAAEMVNNYDWFKEFGFLDFLREVGKYISVNYMMSKDSVKTRLTTGISYTEFTYQLLQGYDFYHLYKNKNIRLQMGGSDQWGNIINGMELTRRVAGNQAYALTSPLLTTASGAKMGKSAAGAVWLNGDMLSPYEFWQFWRNTTDADVGRFLKLYTELPLDECERLGALEGQEINDAKIVLANEVTTLCHGREAAEAAEATAREVFERGGVGEELATVALPAADVSDGISAAQLFVRAGLVSSGKEAKRLIAEGGARVNDEAVTEAGQMFSQEDLAKTLKLAAGKKRHALVKLEG